MAPIPFGVDNMPAATAHAIRAALQLRQSRGSSSPPLGIVTMYVFESYSVVLDYKHEFGLPLMGQ
jgi:hypothetical protein